MKAGNLVNRATNTGFAAEHRGRGRLRLPRAGPSRASTGMRTIRTADFGEDIETRDPARRQRRRSRCSGTYRRGTRRGSRRADRRRRSDRRSDSHLPDADGRNSHAQPPRGDRGRQADRRGRSRFRYSLLGTDYILQAAIGLLEKTLPGLDAVGSHRGGIGDQLARKATHYGCARAESAHAAAVVARSRRLRLALNKGQRKQAAAGLAQPWQPGGPGGAAGRGGQPADPASAALLEPAGNVRRGWTTCRAARQSVRNGRCGPWPELRKELHRLMQIPWRAPPRCVAGWPVAELQYEYEAAKRSLRPESAAGGLDRQALSQPRPELSRT